MSSNMPDRTRALEAARQAAAAKLPPPAKPGLIDRWLRWWRPRPIVPNPHLDDDIAARFRSLLEQESDGLWEAPGWTSHRPEIGVPPSGEPWVTKTANDYVGLALSGGGIRSATFNLGLLQGLDRLRLLSSVGYVTTVSGGGYIGSFWSAWIHRTASTRRPGRPMSEAQHFPGGAIDGNDASRVEDTPEVRHLREFSRFLSPRIGFFETEMWHAILAFAGGLIPTLSVTFAMIALTLVAWLGVTTYLATPLIWCGLSLTVGLAAFFLERLERDWSRSADPEAVGTGLKFNFLFALASLLMTGAAFYGLDAWMDSLAASSATREWAGLNLVIGAGSWSIWRDGIFLGHQGDSGIYVYVRAFEPAAAWAAAALVLLFGRLFLPGFTSFQQRPIKSNALDRVIMRLLGMAVVWILAGGLWHFGVILARIGWAQTWTALAAVLTGGLFSVFRNWLTTAFKQTGKEGFVQRARPFVPIILAYLTIGLLIIWVSSQLAWWLGADPNAVGRTALQWLTPWLLLVGVVGGVLVLMLSLDPADYSLHAFYRDRISRAYLGATNPHAEDRAADNRNADFRADDDLPIKDLPDRPLHLVCCAANDLSGDQVETLSRGSRSVTLSKYGIAMGGFWAPPGPDLTLAAAATASAAAFNSVMGSVSKELGPAVTFLMTALNLRLGLWVRHPATTETPRELPGRSLLREFFGLTNAGLNRDETPEAPVLHLSDGAHFDNLALYELVRRHCRYIIVSDCGADSEVKFDDLGNVVRRVREDFGVEIELDLKPIRSTADSPATQHAVVGTIHYDRHFDKGVIVYFKPTLVGDEPPDVLQYHNRNSAFPHESTVDQFYDESQWESYRRLGFHSAQIAFRFAERLETLTTDAIFTGARQEWYPTPPQLREQVLAMTERFGEIERDIRDAGHTGLLAELFPESAALTVARPPARDREKPAAAEPVSELTTATILLKAMQTMEDVWTECDLDTQSKHPLNVGWINAFARWATSPSFRRWWPVLAPSFSPGFQRFLREQFYQSAAADLPPRGEVRRADLVNGALPPGLAAQWWTDRMVVQPNTKQRAAYEYMLQPPGAPQPLQIGIVLAQESTTQGIPVLRWTSEDFFVPPSLWGGGLGSGFIGELFDAESPLAERGIDMAEVHVISRDRERSSMYRAERISFIEFYRSAGFRTVASGTRSSMPPALRDLLTDTEDLDAWTTMQWFRTNVAEGDR